MAPYRLVDRRLGELLREFGPPRKAVHTEFPFWRLQRDGVWELDRADGISVTSSGDAHKTALLLTNAHGGLIEDIYETLRANHRLAAQVASDLLAAHFQDTQYDDILQAVGIDPEFAAGKRRTMRDPGFRAVVLRAYEYRLRLRCPHRRPFGGARRRPHQVASGRWTGRDSERHRALCPAPQAVRRRRLHDLATCRQQRGPGYPRQSSAPPDSRSRSAVSTNDPSANRFATRIVPRSGFSRGTSAKSFSLHGGHDRGWQ